MRQRSGLIGHLWDYESWALAWPTRSISRRGDASSDLSKPGCGSIGRGNREYSVHSAGKLEPASALRFGLVLSLTGVSYLAVAVHVLASLLAAVTSVSYLAMNTDRHPTKYRVGYSPTAGRPGGSETGERLQMP
jgi:hypothetical protein